MCTSKNIVCHVNTKGPTVSCYCNANNGTWHWSNNANFSLTKNRQERLIVTLRNLLSL